MQQRVHVIHLTMTGARIAAGAIDLFHNHRGLGQTKARSPIFFGDKGGHPTLARQCLDKCIGVSAIPINVAMIFCGKLCAQRTNAIPNVVKAFHIAPCNISYIRNLAQEFQRAIRNVTFRARVRDLTPKRGECGRDRDGPQHSLTCAYAQPPAWHQLTPV